MIRVFGLLRTFSWSLGFESCFFGLNGYFTTVSPPPVGSKGDKELWCVERLWSEGLESSRDLKRDLKTLPLRLD